MPTADLLVTGISQLATPGGTGARHGAAMAQLEITTDAAFTITGGRISWSGPRTAWHGVAREELDLRGRAVVPGLVDPHTHAVWAGDRLGDFEARAAGIPYVEMLRRGGGIRSTMHHTSAASVAELVALAEPRIRSLVTSGATTIEVKSGYGFTREGELASLEAIAVLSQLTPATIVPTLLIHVPPRDPSERVEYIEMTVRELIPEAARGLARAVDIFIEKESFTVDEARTVFHAAREAHVPIKAHVDQFHAIGGLELAIACGAMSVDHLEASGPAQIAHLAESSTIGVILPGVTVHLGLPPANGRAIIDAGGAVAVGTDLNPGSSPLYSVQLAMALTVRLNGLTPAEALTAATANAAAALGLPDAGRLNEGARADFLVLSGRDWRDSVYALGGSPVERIFIGGCEVRA